LEQSPASWSGYEGLADYYAESGDVRSAIEDYKHALELSPGQAAIHDRLALAYYKDGKRAEALAEWKLGFSSLLKQINTGRAPESFWSDFGRACDHLHSRRLFASTKTDVDALVRAYLHRNGNYRSNALLHSVYAATGDPAAATAWLLDVSSSAPDPIVILPDVVEAQWIPLSQRGPILQRILEGKQAGLEKAEGLEKENAQSELRSWQIRWLGYLLDTKQFTQASEFLAVLPRDPQNTDASALVPFELQVAAHLGTLDAKIASYRSDPDRAPGAEILRSSAQQLFEEGDKQSARKILEFVFARELDEHKLVAANFLGLAEIRIAAGDTPGAVELLRRLVTVVGDPYEDMDSAAALLEKTGHNAKAIAFLDPLVKSTPWEPAFRVRLAKAQIAAGMNASGAQDSLAGIAAAPRNPYSQRIEAALALSGSRPAVEFGSAELKLLAGDPKSITPASADQPFFYDARVILVRNSSDARQEVQILSNALADTPARDDARIPLFHAAASLHSDEFAIASIEQLLRDQRIRQVVSRDTGNEEEMLSSEEDAGEQETSPVYAPMTFQAAQRAQLAQSVGVVLLRLHQFPEALAYFRTAQELEKSPGRRKEIAAEISDVRALLRRQQLNAARQPILHADLEQDRLVRPRLVARSAPPAKPAAKPGERP
jgi:tetratricopeptide (TPR) repeat protein